jgi:periplasmic protein TonB
MNSVSVFEELDQAIDAILAGSEALPAGARTETTDLAELARDLQHLARPDFRKSLMVELEWEAAGRSVSAAPENSRRKPRANGAHGDLMSSLFAGNGSLYPVRGVNVAVSVALHAALLLFMGMGFVWVKSTTRLMDLTSAGATRVDPYPFPESANSASRGGSGGAADVIRASEGPAPRFARRQFAPPVLAETTPRLRVEATIVGTPDLTLPETRPVGDPLSRLLVPSPGTGVHGGIGSNDGGGVGDGNKNGLGRGRDGGFGGEGYVSGYGVSAPRAIYKPEPDYSDEARKAGFQGVVVLLAVIGPDGRPAKLRVARSLGMGLDEKALEAVQHWRFEPARKDGRPVAAQIYVEVDFHLF